MSALYTIYINWSEALIQNDWTEMGVGLAAVFKYL